MKRFTLFIFLVATLLLPLVAQAQSMSLQFKQPYGWVNADLSSTFSLGNVNVSTPINYEKLRLKVDGVEGAIDVASSNSNFTPVLGEMADGTIPVTIQFSSTEVGENNASITFSAEGVDPITVNLKATVENLNAPTIFDLKVLAKEKGYNVKMYYTGNARINHFETSQWGYLEVYVEDETGGAVLSTYTPYEEFQFHQGDIVNFSTYLKGGEGQPYVTFQNTEFKATDNEAWEYPSATSIEVPNQFNYGQKVIVKDALYKSSKDILDNEGVKYNLFTSYTTNDGNEFTLFPLGVENPYYNQEAPYTSDTPVDIIGIVIPHSANGGAPTPYLLPLVIRPSVPVAAIKTGKYLASGKSVIYNQVIPWEVNVTIDENDPYTYWFEHLLENLRVSYTPIRATLSPDGKKLGFMVGENSLNENPAGYWCYFAGCKTFENVVGGYNPPYPRGYVIAADVDEINTITFDTYISYLNYCTFWEEIVGVENPETFRWTYIALFEPGVKLIYETPMPLIQQVEVHSEGDSAVLEWDIPSTDGTAYTLTGFSIYCNGIMYAQTPADINTWTHTNLRSGSYTYGVAPVYAEGEADITYAETLNYSGIDRVEDNIGIHTLQGTILIDIPAGNISVSDLTGRLVSNMYVSGKTEIQVEPGIYLITVADKSYKVMVK